MMPSSLMAGTFHLHSSDNFDAYLSEVVVDGDGDGSGGDGDDDGDDDLPPLLLGQLFDACLFEVEDDF